MAGPDPVSEQTLIERILTRLGPAAATDILIPPGDDAAAWHTTHPITVATTDALVEGAHWRADTMSLADVGWRAVATNVSDLAAMGAAPHTLLVSLVVGPTVTPGGLDLLADGIGEACRAHAVRIAGGDLVRGPVTVVAITALGGADQTTPLLRRDAARPDDTIAVSGVLGAAAAGLAAIERGEADSPSAAALLRAHRRPKARVALGIAARTAGVGVGCDISDGLARDLGQIARASSVGIEVDLDALPLAPEATALLGAAAARDAAIGGGDDYELILGGTAEAIGRLRAAISDPPLHTIGRVVAAHPGEVWFTDHAGSRYEPPASGWDPFASPGHPAP